MGIRSGLWLLLASIVSAQIVLPSNNNSDLSDPTSSPRFVIDSSATVGNAQFPRFVVAPLGQYAGISRNIFISIAFSGNIVNTDGSNAQNVLSSDFNFVSCDPESYEGTGYNASALLRIITQQQWNNNREKSSLIFYSTRSSHCNATNFDNYPTINGVFTTVDPNIAAQIANKNFTRASNAAAFLTADKTAFYQGAGSAQQTTAIAMIILYSITGCVTSLFVVVIITGAVRAHRHPERYGPRNTPGRPRQSRAKGIARAMLETIPIVKFGDHHNLPNKDKNLTDDVELADNAASDASKNQKTADKSATATTTVVATDATSTTASAKAEDPSASKADGSDEAGVLGCSICTEDFQNGEEVRVLPCNHKFHPECVDPWLLNVSGTCPLCRISLAPESEQHEEGADPSADMPPPLAANGRPGDRRSLAVSNLVAMAYGSREERINALRRYRTDRRNRNQPQNRTQNTENDEEQTRRSRRFRDTFRIRTRRHEVAETDPRHRDPGVEAISGPQMRV